MPNTEREYDEVRKYFYDKASGEEVFYRFKRVMEGALVVGPVSEGVRLGVPFSRTDLRSLYHALLQQAYRLEQDPEHLCRETFLKKNADYGDAFDAHGPIGVLMTLTHKAYRLVNLYELGEEGASVEEPLLDTLLDALNYLILAEVSFLRQEQKERKEREDA
jgi:hypothetical protein